MIGEAYAKRDVADWSGVDEFREVHRMLADQERPLMPAVSNRKMFQSSVRTNGLPLDVELYSLSPTDEAIHACIKQLASIICNQGPQCRAPDIHPNLSAVVLQLVVGSDSILLGNDMENSSTCGWSAIFSGNARPQERSFAFKVPHHGSESGHSDDVWRYMLDSQPYAFITPWELGRKRLPSPDDVRRIRGLTSRAYITSSATGPRPKIRLSKEAEKTLKEHGQVLRPVLTSLGHIRFRFTPGKPETRRVARFNGAKAL
jgi:hypothetical protein